jgi:hypothetical protein
MALINDPDLLVVGTELTLDTVNKTFALNVAGNLTAVDGVTGQALYSKFIELWETATYNKFDFPAYVIGDPRAGMFAFGFDGTTYNGWKPLNDATRSYLRNIGWSEYPSTATNATQYNRQYVGIVVGASGVPAGAQFYYQKAAGGAPIPFTYTGAPNEAIQVFGDATNGAFNTRDVFKVFCRQYNYSYDDTNLSDVFETATGAYKINMPITVQQETKITSTDAAITGAPYNGITVAYYSADQTRSIGGTGRTFRIIITGNNATAEQIYTKVQFLLRQSTDINTGGTAGAVIGKTADQLLYFVGDTLRTTKGVYIDGFNANDINRIIFNDQGGTDRIFPFTAAGSLSFDSSFIGGVYRAYFASGATAGSNFGEAGAVTVFKADGTTQIAGTITSAAISFDYAYDSNIQRGAGTFGTDVALKVFAIKKGSTKPRFVNYTLTRTVGQTIAFAAEADRGYANP